MGPILRHLALVAPQPMSAVLSIAAKLGAVVTFGTYLNLVMSSNPWDCDMAATGYLHNMLTKTL